MAKPTVRETLSPLQERAGARGGLALPAVAAALVLTYLSARVVTGADTLWMVALGGEVVRTGSVPDGLPFAAADTSGWPNVPVLGEVALYAVHLAGPLGLALALLVADTATLLVLAASARRLGAGSAATSTAILLTAVGMLPVLGVVRAQLLSLVPFACLLALLRREHERPSRRVWLVVPLIAVWGNLHGGVLVGVATTGCYLVFSRLRTDTWQSVLVGLSCLVALWLNPAHVRTGAYYLGVLNNEAARRGTEMWARPDLGSGFDVLMIVAAGVMLLVAVRWGRLAAWEGVAVAGLAVATATSARHGMWLLMFLLGPAAVGLTRMLPGAEPTAPAARRPQTRAVLVVLAVLLAMSGVSLVKREPALRGPSDVVRAVATAARGGTVLAPEPLAEDLAVAGVTVWASNPIDAFSRADQAAYLDAWLGRPNGARVLREVRLVVATAGSPITRLLEDSGFTPGEHIGDVELWRPTGASAAAPQGTS